MHIVRAHLILVPSAIPEPIWLWRQGSGASYPPVSYVGRIYQVQVSKPAWQLTVCFYQRRLLLVVSRACPADLLDQDGRADCGITWRDCSYRPCGCTSV